MATVAFWFCLGFWGFGLVATTWGDDPAPPAVLAMAESADRDDVDDPDDDDNATLIAEQAGKGASGEADKLVQELSEGRVAKLIERFTYAAIIGVLLLCGMGLPLPEEVPILTSGVLASTGHLSPWPALGAVMFGVMLGDSIMFLLGQRWGNRVFELRMTRKLVTPERHQKIMGYFNKYGAWIIFAARFLPGLRAPLFLTAGTMRVPFWVFFAMDGAAALLSIPISFYVAYVFTDKLSDMLEASHQILYWALGGVLLFSVGGHWLWGKFRHKKPADVAATTTATTDSVATDAAITGAATTDSATATPVEVEQTPDANP